MGNTTLPAAAPDDLRSLGLPADAWEVVSVPAGTVLMREGEPADSFYLLDHGELEAYLTGPAGDEVMLGQLRPGSVLGELALLDGGLRAASIRAVTDARLRCLRHEVFLQLLGQSPELTTTLLKRVGIRQRRNLGYLHTLIGWAQLVAEGRYGEAQAAISSEGAAAGGDTARFVDTFAAMVAAVQARESELTRALAALTIDVDSVRTAGQVADITDTPFFRALQQDAVRLRAQRHQKPVADA
jgi:CRP-like cAMP-binding protein